MSRVYFPLKSSVELFDDRETPEAVTRVKQAAILYDEVIIEDGLYTAAISTQGSNSWWEPWSWVDEEKLKHTRRKGKPGSPVSFGVQRQPGPGEPGEGPMQMFSQGGLIIDYAAEFHTGILDDLAELEPDWLQVIAPGGTTAGWPEELRDTVRQLDQGVFFDRELMEDRNAFEKGFITKNFNQDAAMASYLDATFNVTSLYEPMLERGNLVRDHAGHAALELLAPNVGSLTWEAIIEFRDHPGLKEARERLREVEEKAAETDPTDAQEFRDRVQAEITSLFFQALEELRPHWAESTAKEVTKTAIGLIPAVGPLAAGLASAGEIAAAEAHYRRSWHAALLKLRSAV